MTYAAHTRVHQAPALKEPAVPTPNYAYEKRQRELAKKRKAEEKRQKKLAGGGADDGADDGTPGAGTDGAPPRAEPGASAPAGD